MRNNRQRNVSTILFIVSSIILCMLCWYNSRKLSSGYIEDGTVKAVNENNSYGEIMLTYGPYHKLADADYLMILAYKTDSDNNRYELYADECGVIREQILDKNKIFTFARVKWPDVGLQVLTKYGGNGSFEIFGVGIVPIWQVFVWMICVICLAVLYIYPDVTKKSWIFLIYLPFFLLFLGSAYSVDCSSNSLKNGWGTAGILLIGVLVLASVVFEKIQKAEMLGLLTIGAIWFLEWRNIQHYGFKYMTLYLTICISFGVVLLIYLLNKHRKLYNILLIGLTTIFGLYSIAQYMYFTYFRDFFTLKIIGLFFTAMEASASINELFTVKVLSYIIILSLYYVMYIGIKRKVCTGEEGLDRRLRSSWVKDHLKQIRNDYLHKQYEKEYLFQKDMYYAWQMKSESKRYRKHEKLNHEYCLLIGEGIRLSDFAITLINQKIKESGKPDIIYGDEDFINDIGERVEPFLSLAGLQIHL